MERVTETGRQVEAFDAARANLHSSLRPLAAAVLARQRSTCSARILDGRLFNGWRSGGDLTAWVSGLKL